MRSFQKVVLAYFVIGAVMWGGGAIEYADTGVTQAFINIGGDEVSPTGVGVSSINDAKGAIGGILQFAAGTALVVLNLAKVFFKFIHWPVFVLSGNGAPQSVTVLVGGSMVVAFYLTIISLFTDL